MHSLLKFTALFAVVSLVSLSPLSAQERKYPPRMIRVPNATDILIMKWGRTTCRTVDTAFLSVTYDTRYRRTTQSDPLYRMLTMLRTGRVRHKYYSLIRQLQDDVQIGMNQQLDKLPKLPGIGVRYEYTEAERHIKETAGTDWLNSEVWIDRVTNTLTERAHDYSKNDLSIEYEEALPGFEWTITAQRDTLCGYVCFEATTSFRGRDWIAWFAPDIPVDAGPWKLRGLPGLILKAQDAAADFIWECVEVSQQAHPIVYYSVPSLRLSREKWHRYLRQVHEDPLGMLGENGNCGLYVAGKRITPEDHWQLPYNPIELE